MSLAIEINFLRQAYFATDHSEKAETIVAPIRLHAGLVQAACVHDIAGSRDVLRQLERADPPEIHMGDIFTDPKLNTDSTTKRYAPVHASHEQFPPKKPTKDSKPLGMTNDEIRRPAVRMKEPRCIFVWPGLDLTEGERHSLDLMLREVMRVGRVESLALAHRVDDPDFSGLNRKFVPDPEEGTIFVRVPREGTLEAYEGAYEEGSHLDHWLSATYRRVGVSDAHESIWADGMLRYRLEGAPVHASRALRLVEAFNAKVCSLEREGLRIPPVFTGHGWGNRLSSHAAVVPLVYAKDEHADGFVKGLAVCLPSGTLSEDHNLILAALDEVCRSGFHLYGQPLSLSPLSAQKSLVTLRKRRWEGPAKKWTTVTPVVLEVPPKKNRTVERIIARSCSYSGLPFPTEVHFSRDASCQGIPSANDFIVRRHKERSKGRFFGHVSLTFKENVKGPVVVGLMRHFGLGLMVPQGEENDAD